MSDQPKSFKKLIKDVYSAGGFELTPEKEQEVIKNYEKRPEQFVKDFFAENNIDLPDQILLKFSKAYLSKPIPEAPGSKPVDGVQPFLRPKQKVEPKEEVVKPREFPVDTKLKTPGLGLPTGDGGFGSSLTDQKSFGDIVRVNREGTALQQSYARAKQAYADAQGEDLINETERAAQSLQRPTISRRDNDDSNELSFIGDTKATGKAWMNSINSGIRDIAMGAVDIALPGFEEEKDEVEKFYNKYVLNELNQQEKDLVDNSFVRGGISDALNSVPAMAIPMGAGFFLQSYKGSMDEINSTEEGRNLPQGAKTVYAGANAFASRFLEQSGLDRILKLRGINESFTKGLINTSLKELYKNTKGEITSQMLSTYIGNKVEDIAKGFARSGVRSLDDYLSEAVTGGSEEAVKIASEYATNALSEGEVFDTKDFSLEGMWENAKRVGDAAHSEGRAGLFIGKAGREVKRLLGKVDDPIDDVDRFVVNPTQRNIVKDLKDQANALVDGIKSRTVSDDSKAYMYQKLFDIRNKLEKELSDAHASYSKVSEQGQKVIEAIALRKEEAENALEDPNLPEDVKSQLEADVKEMDDQLEAITKQESESTPKAEIPKVKAGDTVMGQDGKKHKVFFPNKDGSFLDEFGNKIPASEIKEVKPFKETEPKKEKEDPKVEVSPETPIAGMGITPPPVVVEAPKVEVANEEVKTEQSPTQETPKAEVSPALKDVESTTKALEEVGVENLDIPLPQLEIGGYKRKPSEQYRINDTNSISEAYHIAKSDGSNPELVKAVEKILTTQEAGVNAPITPISKEAKKDAEAFARMDVEEEISLKEEQELSRLTDDVINAQKDISRSDDPDSAIAEYNKAKKAKEDFEAQITKRKDKVRGERNIKTLLEDEADNLQKGNYEYKELYDKDPRLAALQNAKDMLEFIESGDLEKAYIEQGESTEEAKSNVARGIENSKRDIADLEGDIKANPVVENKVEVAPELSPVKVDPSNIKPLEGIDAEIDSLEEKINDLEDQLADEELKTGPRRKLEREVEALGKDLEALYDKKNAPSEPIEETNIAPEPVVEEDPVDPNTPRKKYFVTYMPKKGNKEAVLEIEAVDPTQAINLAKKDPKVSAVRNVQDETEYTPSTETEVQSPESTVKEFVELTPPETDGVKFDAEEISKVARGNNNKKEADDRTRETKEGSIRAKYEALKEATAEELPGKLKEFVNFVMNARYDKKISSEDGKTKIDPKTKKGGVKITGLNTWIKSAGDLVASRTGKSIVNGKNHIDILQSEWAKEIDKVNNGGTIYNQKAEWLGLNKNDESGVQGENTSVEQGETDSGNTNVTSDVKPSNARKPKKVVQQEVEEEDTEDTVPNKVKEEDDSVDLDKLSPKLEKVDDDTGDVTGLTQVGLSESGKPIMVKSSEKDRYNRIEAGIQKKLDKILGGELTPSEVSEYSKQISANKEILLSLEVKPPKKSENPKVKAAKKVVSDTVTDAKDIVTLEDKLNDVADKLADKASKAFQGARNNAGSNGISPQAVEYLVTKLAEHLVRAGVKVIKTANQFKKYFGQLERAGLIPNISDYENMTKTDRANIIKLTNAEIQAKTNKFGVLQDIAAETEKSNKESKALSKDSTLWGRFKRFARAEKWTDRTYDLTNRAKKDGKGVGSDSPFNESIGEKTERAILSISGAYSKADRMYQVAVEKIFGNPLKSNWLSNKERKLLGELIKMRRIIELDNARIAKGQPLMKHPNGITKVEAEIFINGLKNATPEFLGANGISKDDYDFNDLDIRAGYYFNAMQELLDLRYKEGLISEAAYTAMKEAKYYSPRRFLHHMINDVDISSKNISVSNSVKSMKDGDEKSYIENPDKLLADAVNMVNESVAKNNAFKALYELSTKVDTSEWLAPAKYTPSFMKKVREALAKKQAAANAQNLFTVSGVGNPEDDYQYKHIQPQFTSPPEGWRVVTFFDNGVKKAFHIKNEYADQLEGLRTWEGKKVLGLVSGAKITSALATGTNWYFAVTNTLRDAQFIMMTTNHYSSFLPLGLTQYARDYAMNFVDAFTHGKKYREFISTGGGRDFSSKEISLSTGEDSRASEAWSKAVYNLFERLPQTTELASRMAVRKAVLGKLKKEAIAKGKDITNPEILNEIKEKASFEAANFMDFSQGGVYAKNVNTVIPFFNAGILGTRNFYRYVKSNPAKAALKITQLIGTSVALANWNNGLMSWTGGEDEKDEMGDYYRRYIPYHEKSRYFITMLPFPYKDKDGNKVYPYLRIPKSQEQMLFAGLAEVGVLTQNFGKEHAENYFNLQMGSRFMQDIGGLISYLPDNGNLVPPVLKIPFTYITNYDFFRGEQITRIKGTVKEKDEFNPLKTPNFWKKFGELTGLSPDRSYGAFKSAIPTNNQWADMASGLYKAIDGSITEQERIDMKESEPMFAQFPAFLNRAGLNPDEKEKVFKSLSEDLLKTPFANRLFKTTMSRPIDEGRQDLIKEIGSDRKQDLDQMKIEIARYREGLQSIEDLEDKAVSIANGDIDSEKRMIGNIKAAIKLEGADPVLLDIYMTNIPEIQAQTFAALLIQSPEKKRIELSEKIAETALFGPQFYYELEEVLKKNNPELLKYIE